jgi:hypothetical protein
MKCYNCQSSVHVIDVNIYLWGNANVWRCKEFDIKTYIYYAFESKHVKIKKFAGNFLYKFMMLGIEDDDIFVSDGAKCDISRLQVNFVFFY